MSVIRLRPAKGQGRAAFTTPPVETQVRALRLQRRLALVGALIGLVVTVVACLPASLLVNAIANATHDQVLLAEADGTIWNGSALPVLSGGKESHDASSLPSRLSWRLRPRWNGLELTLAQDCCLPRGVAVAIRRRQGAWEVTVEGPSARPVAVVVPAQAASSAAVPPADTGLTTIAQFPANWLEGIGFPFNTVHPGGTLALSTQDFAIALQGGHWHARGTIALELRQASSRLSTLETLGSYRIAFAGAPAAPGDAAAAGADHLDVTLTTLDGALLADGAGQLTQNGGFHFHGKAQAAPGSEAALNNLLNLIGRRNGALSVISIG